MSSLIVLSDAAVHEILISLSRDEIHQVRDRLAKSLEEFSTPEERNFAPDSVVVTRPHAKTLFRPFTSSENVGIKIIVDPSAGAEAQASSASSNATLHGVLALCDRDGLPLGIINADEITGYRTSLSVMVPYAWRTRTTRIVVFGAGKQALWHIRLALALRGDEIEHIAIVNRSAARGESLLSQVRSENEQRWRSSVEMLCVSSTRPDYEQKLESLMATADVVFCTTPSTKPLFPARYLKVQQASSTGCYISSIGSWQPDMMELDPQLLQHGLDLSRGQHPLGDEGGAILVDDREESLRSSGEIINSQLRAEQLVEVGEVLSSKTTTSKDQSSSPWLADGFVIYKSVGVSATDLAAGTAVLSLARERGVGVSVSDF
ncbi:hypothetical protein H2204_006790 [Knufia peltigerae]|uniref:Ornithine cyclodeaminase n=1 Tax=Knufia peltigerae TaxID=1002370 RepID=A0AA38Y2U8_9EURO|nr:hypothetical protein H2204_006790 [Knufia peltigerae]